MAVSFGAFSLLPTGLSGFLPLLPSHATQLSTGLALLYFALTYLLLSWVWLIGRIMHDLFGRTPRGGHPAATEP